MVLFKTVAEHLPPVYGRATLPADSVGVTAITDRARFSSHQLLSPAWRRMAAPFAPLLDRVLSLDRLQNLYHRASARSASRDLLTAALDLLEIEYHVEAGSLDWIPRTGPVLVTANHPFGLLEGAILAAVLRQVRPDVRILANSLLSAIPELRDLCIFADPSGSRSSVTANAGALKDCMEWLERGGLLAAFPAGEVSHLQLPQLSIRESEWRPAVARLAQHARATAVPVYFPGSNNLLFQVAGLIHPFLRTMRLPRELFNKAGRRIAIRIGRPIAPATLAACGDGGAAIEHIRRRTDLLARNGNAPSRPAVRLEPIADPVDPALLAGDVASLPLDRKLGENGGLSVWLAASDELPHVLREIGRLREIAFRGAGEGSGHSRDLDRFDPHYLHLFLWNADAREVAGAYRLAATADVLPKLGPSGLYTSTLFRYRGEFFERIGPAIELGRSFVTPKYQKQFSPLLLLWKGITRYAASRPECGTLFGAASISNAYLPESRDLMVGMLQRRRACELTPLVSGRNPYRVPAFHGPADPDQLSKLLSDLEPDGKGVPILLKQYLKAGARVVAFNVDPAFANSLDALVLVDLKLSAATSSGRRFARQPSGLSHAG